MKCFLLCMVCFELCTACSLSENTAGTTSDDFSTKEGDSVTINCTLFKTAVQRGGALRHVNSTRLRFKSDSSKEYIPEEKISYPNPFTAQVNISNVSLNDSGYYYCYLNYDESKSDEVVCSTHLQVQTPPRAVQNISCTSNNLQELVCHWETADHSDVTYELKLESTTFKGIFHKCKIIQPNSCVWNKANEGPSFFPSETYMIYLTGSNSLGTLTQAYFFNQYENLMPFKPKAFTKILPTTDSLFLEWLPPEGLETKLSDGLNYELQYYATDSSELKMTIKTDQTSYTIESLRPYVYYVVEIRCKSKQSPEQEKYWSNPLRTTNQTYADVPYKVPDHHPQGFLSITSNNLRKFVINWRSLPKKDHNGPAFHYKVECYHTVGTELRIYDPLTRNVSYPCVTYEKLYKRAAYTFRVYSVNAMGPSEKYIEFFIDKEDNLPPPPNNLAVFLLLKSRAYHVTWTDLEPGAEMTLFWSKPAEFCPSNSEWAKVESPSPFVFTHFPERYWFGVATKLGGKLSGLTIIECIWYEDIKVSFNHLDIQPKQNGLRVQWTLGCNFATNGFFIEICERNEDFKCSKEEPRLTYNTTQNESHIDIPDLKPYTLYHLKVGYMTHLGRSKVVESRTVRTKEAPPSGPPMNVTLVSITYDSIHLKWAPPSEMNGPLHNYRLNYGRYGDTSKTTDIILRKGISGYTNYTIKITASVLPQNQCDSPCLPYVSPPASLEVQTPKGVPGRIKTIQEREINDSSVLVFWDPPEDPEGPIDLYMIELPGSTVNTTATEYKIFYGLGCEQELKEVRFNYSIRAVNIQSGKNLEGTEATRSFFRSCPRRAMSTKLIICIIAITCILIIPFSIAVVYQIVKLYKKANKFKGLNLQLPEALDNVILFLEYSAEIKPDSDKPLNIVDDAPAKDAKRSVSTASTQRSALSTSSAEDVDNVFDPSSSPEEQHPPEPSAPPISSSEIENEALKQRRMSPDSNANNRETEDHNPLYIISTTSAECNVPSYVMVNELGMPVMQQTKSAYIQPNQILGCDMFLTPQQTRFDICT